LPSIMSPSEPIDYKVWDEDGAVESFLSRGQEAEARRRSDAGDSPGDAHGSKRSPDEDVEDVFRQGWKRQARELFGESSSEEEDEEEKEAIREDLLKSQSMAQPENLIGDPLGDPLFGLVRACVGVPQHQQAPVIAAMKESLRPQLRPRVYSNSNQVGRRASEK
jgi:hypothetical protein